MNLQYFLFITLTLAVSACSQNTEGDNQKNILVRGSAEVNAQPDIIELEVILKEYGGNEDKKNLEQVEHSFFTALENNDISKDNVIIGESGFYWYYWWNYRNKFYKQRKYRVKLEKPTDLMSLVKDLNIEGVLSLRIANTSNTGLQVLRKEVKISAITAAKEKAHYLLESIGEELGDVIYVKELPDNSNNYFWRNNQNNLSNIVISGSQNDADFENVSMIKLRYVVEVQFEIKE